MFRNYIQRWVWSGIDRSAEDDITPIKLTNTIALVACVVLVLQLPTAISLFEAQGFIKILAIAVIIVLLCLVPILNRCHFPILARTLLITGYLTYIFISTVSWQHNLNHHYFLLLGIFVCPFLFYQDEEPQVWQSIGTFALLFVCLDMYWYFSSIANQNWLTYESIITASNGLFFIVATLLCGFHIRRNINLSRASLNKAHDLTQRLLKHTLPSHVIAHMRQSESRVHEFHPCVSVLFADFQGYSQLCNTFSGSELVHQLNSLYSSFDKLCVQAGMLKIKTNGDEYMAVSGIAPLKNNCALDCCKFAKALLETHQQFRRQFDLSLGLRIGIATGEVHAGIIGKQSLSYDLWGDTVNLASRLESSAPVDRIQVCKKTAHMTQANAKFSARGEIKLKGIGKLESYLLTNWEPYV